MKNPPDPLTSSTLHRAVGAAFGMLLVAAAILMIVYADASSWLPVALAALVTGGLGLDAVASAVRGTRSLLSRIGPLP